MNHNNKMSNSRDLHSQDRPKVPTAETSNKKNRLTCTQRPPETEISVSVTKCLEVSMYSTRTSNCCFSKALLTTSKVSPTPRASVLSLSYSHHVLGSDFSRSPLKFGDLRSNCKSCANAGFRLQAAMISSTLTACGPSRKTAFDDVRF